MEGFNTHAPGCVRGGKMLLEIQLRLEGAFFFLATCVLFMRAIFSLKCGCDWLSWLVFCCLFFCLFPTTAICVCTTTDAKI